MYRTLAKTPNRAAVSGFLIALIGVGIGFAGFELYQRWLVWPALLVTVAGIAIGIAEWMRFPTAYRYFLAAFLILCVEVVLNICGISLSIAGTFIFLACGVAGFVSIERQKLIEARMRKKSQS